MSLHGWIAILGIHVKCKPGRCLYPFRLGLVTGVWGQEASSSALLASHGQAPLPCSGWWSTPPQAPGASAGLPSSRKVCPSCLAPDVHPAQRLDSYIVLLAFAKSTLTTESISQSDPVLLHADKLRKTILAFYAQTSDHVKRLTSPVANGKFSSTSAGPDTPWGRPEALRTVVTDLKVRLTSAACASTLAASASGSG